MITWSFLATDFNGQLMQALNKQNKTDPALKFFGKLTFASRKSVTKIFENVVISFNRNIECENVCRVWRGLYYDVFLSDRYPCIWGSFLCYFYVSSISCQVFISMRSFINQLRTIHGSITDDRFGLVWDKNKYVFEFFYFAPYGTSIPLILKHQIGLGFHVKETSL